MKIALVCPASLPATQFGGIMYLCLDIARELSKISHDITIYTTDLDFANNASTFNKDLPRHEKIGNFLISRSHVWFSIQLFYMNPGMYFQMLKSNPDIIHSIGVRSFQAFVAALIAKKKKIPLIISDQGGLTTHPDLKNHGIIKKILYTVQKPMIKFVINQATKISIPNDYEKKIFAEFNADSKCVLIRNGINLEELKTDVDFRKKYSINEKIILFVGRFNKVKGVDVLINAFNLIKNNSEIVNTKLVIMGVDFGFESEMIKLINDCNLQDKILVIKKPPREDVIAAYSACDFIVLPSRWELSPLTPLEAFAFKKPVISTIAHGIPYTIQDGENSILVEPDNYHLLAKAILQLLNDDKKRHEYGNRGYELVKEICNSKTMAQNSLKLYKQVINAK